MTFIINRWVRGEDFYGRDELLISIEQRIGRPTWILGNRRVGKTSLLREIEWRSRNGDWPGTLALYWDLQGGATSEGLKDTLLESLEDAPEVLEALELEIEILEDLKFFEIINRFRRKIKTKRNEHFLLLIDECEELVDVAKKEPGILSSFRKLSHTHSLSMILAGSLRLTDLDESATRTSPFLPDFLPPVLLGPFSEQQSTELLVQNDIDEQVAAQIHHICFGNPHLLQVIGEHYSRHQDLEYVLSNLKRDKVCHYFFKSNFQCLPDVMQGWWKAGESAKKLLDLSPQELFHDYAVQSSLLRKGPSGSLEVSPLLIMVEGGAIPKRSGQTPVPAEPPAQTNTSPVNQLIETLSTQQTALSVLNIALASGTSFEQLAEAKSPPSLSLMASLEESDEKIHEVLDGASPEYALGKEPDGRTSVYLVGLFLYRHYFGGSPFKEINDPWERVSAIADRDVPIETAKAVCELNPKRAMILVRCLKADPAQRYASLAKLSADLDSA